MGNKTGDINMITYLNDTNTTTSFSAGFSQRPSGLFKRATGALYGRIVWIVYPSWRFDFIKTPAIYFPRKVFNTPNVKCIVDDEK